MCLTYEAQARSIVMRKIIRRQHGRSAKVGLIDNVVVGLRSDVSDVFPSVLISTIITPLINI